MHISAQLSFVKLCTRSFIQIYHLFVQHFFFFECAHAYGRFHLDEAIFVLNYKSRFSNIYTKKFCAQHTASTFYATLYRQQQAAITPAMTVSREKKKNHKIYFQFFVRRRPFSKCWILIWMLFADCVIATSQLAKFFSRFFFFFSIP